MRIAILGLVAFLAVSGTLHAGVLADDTAAYTDGEGFQWKGTSVFDSGVTLQVTVDWAVYAPGDFHFDGYTPTPGEFVYAYQADITGTSVLTKFTVYMMDSNEANNIGTFTIGTGRAPDTVDFQVPGSENLVAAEFWWSPGLAVGAASSGLVFSSINAPLDYFGSVTDHGESADGEVPSPSNLIPEPTTMGLIVAGLLGWVSRRRR